MARSVGAANTPPTADKATRKGEKETMMMMMMMMMMDDYLVLPEVSESPYFYSSSAAGPLGLHCVVFRKRENLILTLECYLGSCA
jgi:hypothetical protein